MSTKDDQITANESPAEDSGSIPVTGESVDIDSLAENAGEQPGSVVPAEVPTPAEDDVGEVTEEGACTDLGALRDLIRVARQRRSSAHKHRRAQQEH